MRIVDRLSLLIGSLGFVLMLACQPATGHSADFSLYWNPNTEPDVLGYYVYYQKEVPVADDPSVAARVTADLDTPGFDADQPSFVLTGLEDDTLYYFAVSAYSAAGESMLSDEVSLRKTPDDTAGDSEAGGSGGGGGCFIGAVQWYSFSGTSLR